MKIIFFSRWQSNNGGIGYRLKITTEDPYEKLVLKEMLSQSEISEIREEHQRNMSCVERVVHTSPGGWDVRPEKKEWTFNMSIIQEFPFGKSEHLEEIGREIKIITERRNV